MKLAVQALFAVAVGLGGMTLSVPDADAQRVLRRGPPPYAFYRRPAYRYYYAAPILAAPAVTYYNSGRRYSCPDLEYRCDKGADWACRILERDPNC